MLIRLFVIRCRIVCPLARYSPPLWRAVAQDKGAEDAAYTEALQEGYEKSIDGIVYLSIPVAILFEQPIDAIDGNNDVGNEGQKVKGTIGN